MLDDYGKSCSHGGDIDVPVVKHNCLILSPYAQLLHWKMISKESILKRYTLIETAFIVIFRNDVLPWWKHLYMYVSQLVLAFVVQLIWTAPCYEV